MYEIRDLDVPDVLYAIVATIAEAEEFLEQRSADTEAQLHANGEGATTGVRLAAGVYGPADDLLITWVETIPAHARRP